MNIVCECSIYYKKKTGLITVGRPGGTRFFFTPANFVKTFEIVKHPQESDSVQLQKIMET